MFLYSYTLIYFLFGTLFIGICSIDLLEDSTYFSYASLKKGISVNILNKLLKKYSTKCSKKYNRILKHQIATGGTVEFNHSTLCRWITVGKKLPKKELLISIFDTPKLKIISSGRYYDVIISNQNTKPIFRCISSYELAEIVLDNQLPELYLTRKNDQSVYPNHEIIYSDSNYSTIFLDFILGEEENIYDITCVMNNTFGDPIVLYSDKNANITIAKLNDMETEELKYNIVQPVDNRFTNPHISPSVKKLSLTVSENSNINSSTKRMVTGLLVLCVAALLVALVIYKNNENKEEGMLLLDKRDLYSVNKFYQPSKQSSTY